MTLQYEFTAMGVSENWLHDSICDFHLDTIALKTIDNIEEGMGIYLNKGIDYELTEFNLLKSVLTETQTDAYQSIKMISLE